MLTPIDEFIKRSTPSPLKRGRVPIDSPLLSGDTEADKRALKSLIAVNGLTPTDIAHKLGIKSQSVSQVIHRRANSRRVLRELENLPVQV